MDNQNIETTELMEKLAKVHALMHRYQAYEARSSGGFSSPHRGQGRVLGLLKLQPEISQRELGYLLDMRSQSLGELLMKLERGGFITREPAQDDRRVMNIRLTDAGRQAAEGVDDRSGDVKLMFDCLSDDEQAQLGEYLDRILESMVKRLTQLGIEVHREPPEGHGRGWFGGGHGHGHGGPWGGRRHSKPPRPPQPPHEPREPREPHPPTPPAPPQPRQYDGGPFHEHTEEEQD